MGVVLLFEVLADLHGWLALHTYNQAAVLYRSGGFDPGIDYFTISMHSTNDRHTNSRHMCAVNAVHRTVSGFYRNCYLSSEPRMHCNLITIHCHCRQPQLIFTWANHISDSLIRYALSHTPQIVKQSKPGSTCRDQTAATRGPGPQRAVG